MALPVVIPNTFANANASIPLSQLDNNFSTVAVAINGMANGAESLSNVNITGGSIANASLSNVSISSGNVTINVANVTTLDATNVEVTNIKAKDGTASATIADSTGVMTIGSSVLTTTDINGGTIDNTSIGATTPNTGAFTTLSATGIITGSSTTTPFIASGANSGTSHLEVIRARNVTTAAVYGDWINTSGRLVWGVESSAGGILLSGTAAYAAVLHSNSTNPLSIGVNNTVVGNFSTTGLAVTGTLSATSASSAVHTLSSTDTRLAITSTGSGQTVGVDLKGGAGGGSNYNYIQSLNSADVQQWYIGGNGTADTLAFKTATTERMRIDSSGNVGIGTSSPYNNASFTSLSIGGSKVGFIGLNNASGTMQATIDTFNNQFRIGTNGTINPIVFNTGGSVTEAMRIDSSGNVGISTTSPSTYGKFAVQTQTSNAPTVAITGSGLNPQLNHYINDSTAVLRNLNQIQFVTGSSDISNYQGYMTFSTMGSAGGTISERMRIDASGNVLVGTTTATAKLSSVAGSNKIGLYVEGYLASNPTAYIYRDNTDAQYGLWVRHDGPLIGSGGTGYMIQFQDRNGGALGSITSSGTGAGSTAYNTSSDYRLKNTIAPMTGALAKVAALKPVTYKWNADGSDGEGFIAHELAEVCPQAVTGEKDAVDDEGKPVYQGIDTSFLVATLTAAIKEQQAIIESLTTRIAALEAQ
jgi:hypothetical protein